MTIKDYIDSSATLGGITDECQAINMLNAARQLLWPLDDWVGTIEYGCVNANNACFYLPAHIETVRKAWVCNSNVPINNENWLYIENAFLNDYCSTETAIVRTDRSAALPVSFPKGWQIGFRFSDAFDVGKEISVTIGNAFGSITTEVIRPDSDDIAFAELLVQELISINKPATIGGLQIYAKSGCECKRIHILQAFETSSRYWQYKSNNVCSCLVIKGKKRYFPYKEDDLYRAIDIQNISALQFASQAIEHQRNKNYSEYQKALLIARTFAERFKEDLKKTSSPGVVATFDVSLPTGCDYGY